MSTFAVDYSALSNKIRAGRLDKTGEAFAAHCDVTDQALLAVARWLTDHQMSADIGDGPCRYRLSCRATWFGMTENPRCFWCRKHNKPSEWEQKHHQHGWQRLCRRCADRRLANPWNALLEMRHTI